MFVVDDGDGGGACRVDIMPTTESIMVWVMRVKTGADTVVSVVQCRW